MNRFTKVCATTLMAVSFLASCGSEKTIVEKHYIDQVSQEKAKQQAKLVFQGSPEDASWPGCEAATSPYANMVAYDALSGKMYICTGTEGTEEVPAGSGWDWVEVSTTAQSMLILIDAMAKADDAALLSIAMLEAAGVTGAETANLAGYRTAVASAAGVADLAALQAIVDGVNTPEDTTVPTIGAEGAITTASVADTTLTLNWTKATDDVSVATALKYYVYQSTTDNIATVENAETNGTLLNEGGTADIATYDVTGLTAETAYYFNIIVEDEAGNKSVYVTKTETTTATL